MNQTILHLAFVAIFVVFFGIRMYWHWRARRERGAVTYREGALNRGLRIAFGVPFVLMLLVYCFRPETLAWAQLPLPEWARWLGLALGLLAVPLSWWVQVSLGANFDTTLHVREGHTLVTHGPYRWVRHPMYSVLYLFELALLLLSANWLIGGVPLVVLTLIVVTRLDHEEATMIETFGEAYRAYMRRTGRLLPRF
ncbi:MAG TPA: isoprenylcysteine carboxylmethyltransferase family protein [Roseiflexaceae bacterium]|nr:isoprenylcysteine carboxylmethyltransferase family protein [Roseiflexaceae bacterium]